MVILLDKRGNMVSESDRHRKALDPRASHGARAESLSGGRGGLGGTLLEEGCLGNGSPAQVEGGAGGAGAASG